MSHSLFDSFTSEPATLTIRHVRSTVRSPCVNRGSAPWPWTWCRNAVRIRATSSAMPNGFRHVIVGAKVQRVDLSAFVAAAREDDDGHTRSRYRNLIYRTPFRPVFHERAAAKPRWTDYTPARFAVQSSPNNGDHNYAGPFGSQP